MDATVSFDLEAQQRYFSYRAILVAIVSQKFCALVFMRYRTIIARYVAKWGIAQILDGQNRQSPIASVQRMRPTLASHSAVPRGTNTTPMNADRAIRTAAQRTQGL